MKVLDVESEENEGEESLPGAVTTEKAVVIKTSTRQVCPNIVLLDKFRQFSYQFQVLLMLLN